MLRIAMAYLYALVEFEKQLSEAFRQSKMLTPRSHQVVFEVSGSVEFKG